LRELENDLKKLVNDLRRLDKHQYKIWKAISSAEQLKCPRCGKEGKLMQKTTISKQKYKYKKWYVYHEVNPFPKKPKFRKQQWCYLNKNLLNTPFIKKRIDTIETSPKLLKDLSNMEQE
jgi:hypothetical protein